MLTYQDRLQELKKTKIAHTLGKRSQSGYLNADDYGTVPRPDDYHFTPRPTSPNGGFYGYQGMADNFCALLAGHPVYVDPLEMLCGRWRDMLASYRIGLRWDELRFPYDDLKPLQALYDITSGIDNDAHLACDYTIGLELGFGGLLQKIRHYRTIHPEKADFYDAEEQVLLAIVDFIRRHIDRIDELLQQETRPEIRQSLQLMRETNASILSEPPLTFQAACQWVSWFNCVSRIYTRDGAGFQLDGLLRPYFEQDLQNGRLDRETACFIMANLLLIDPHYYQISGIGPDGQDLTNSLSYLILDAAHALNIANNLTVRVHPDCNPDFLKKAVECLFSDRNGWPRFANDESLVQGYMRNGISREIARTRIAVGCNWMCIPGRECPMNDTVKINLAKVFAVSLDELDLQDAPSTAKLFELFCGHLQKAVTVAAAGVNLHLDHQWEVTPELVMNLMMRHTLEEGLDITQCADFYTIGLDGAGLAVAADSFAAVQQRIELEKVLSWTELRECLSQDFAGVQGERIRLMLAGSERYCQGDSLGDRWASQITAAFTRLVKAQPMPKGRQFIPGWFSWSRTIEFGAKVGATPNGRKAGLPISHGANPLPGFRKDGAVTAMSTGIANVQSGYGNTAPLQLEFDPRLSREEGGIDRVINLIRTHFQLGGTLININVLDGKKLLAAHQDPDQYPDLVVRVTGFTAYFALLSPEFRQLVVDRFLQGF